MRGPQLILVVGLQSAVTKIREQPIVTNLVPLNASESEAILSRQPDARGEQSDEVSGPTGNAGQRAGETGARAQDQPSPPPPGEWTSQDRMLLPRPWHLHSGPRAVSLICTLLTGLKRFLPVDAAAAGDTRGNPESSATDRRAAGDVSNEASDADAALYLGTQGEGFPASLAEV